jgi:hypothetical protein
MIAGHIRRLAALMIGLALVLSPLAQAGAVAEQSMEMSAMGMSGMVMPEGCDLCGDGEGISAGTCVASCTVPGIVLSHAPLSTDDTRSTIVARPGAAATDRHPPPDPFPPKSS